ncbi:amidoligase enzyme [Nibribacter ruber]|uniref:Amidoligase enzyme n=1 Tax=Nibribacter ruber TaxID=2698458 RepID=A0A6P1NZQ4_9BACT|nr:amidoligase family protein [Nibribacter ruber]QHL87431.1 amidoligase enzyme [Nibribacter ruber]
MTAAEILALPSTKTYKMQQLLTLGFTRKQVAEMMGVGYGFVQNVYAAMQRRGQIAAATAAIFNRTFGVEIEAYGVSMTRLKAELAAAGISIEIEGYNHTTRNHWKLVTDASVSGQEAFELVSPVLQGEAGIEELKKVCQVLKRCNAKVNKSCGMHIHFGAADFGLAQWKNLFKNYLNYEGLIDSFMPVSRRGSNNMYCKSLLNRFSSKAAAYTAIEGCTTLEKIAEKVNGQSRYSKLNVESFFRHGTVEFRQHSGTIEFEKVENWVRFLNNLIDFSKDKVATEQSIDSLTTFNHVNIVNFYRERITTLAA